MRPYGVTPPSTGGPIREKHLALREDGQNISRREKESRFSISFNR